MRDLTKEDIDRIIELFNGIGVWNNGKFAIAVTDYCKTNNLDVDLVNNKLEIAFRDYLATNIKSEAAIRLRLSSVLPKNVAL